MTGEAGLPVDGELDPDDDLDDDEGEFDDDDELVLEVDDIDDDDLEDEIGGAGNRLTGAVPKAVLEYVAGSIVDHPDAVVVDLEEGRHGVMLRLHVAPEDMGKVIGRRGRVAQAIRAVVRAAGAREGVDTQVDIVE